MKIISWNVNGIRACFNKGFLTSFIQKENPDILCIQESRASKKQFPQELFNLGYEIYVNDCKIKKGYSGVSLFTKIKPKNISYGFGIEKFDIEARVIKADFNDFILFNIYFPNGKQSDERLKYKMDFYSAFEKVVLNLKNEKNNLVICGDVNTAHKEIDLARPKENKDVSGFLEIERDFLTNFIKKGFIDTFRVFNKEGGNYSWWAFRSGARKRNVGWRIDYFYINEEFKDKLRNAFILKDEEGSDHCPIGIELEL